MYVYNVKWNINAEMPNLHSDVLLSLICLLIFASYIPPRIKKEKRKETFVNKINILFLNVHVPLSMTLILSNIVRT